MKPVHIALSAALMLGGMSAVYAQDAPPQSKEPPAQIQKSQGQDRGTDRGNARAERGQSEARPGKRSDDGRKAEKSQNREGAGQSRQRQAQDDDGARKRKGEDRASKKDDADDSKSPNKKSQASRKDDGKADAKSAERSRKDAEQDKSRRATRQNDEPKKRARTRDDQQKDEPKKRAETKEDRDGGKAARADLKGEKQERVRSVLRERSSDVKERTDVDIDISIGRSLPRDWNYYPLPTAVIEIVPEYRGYDYVYVDDRYVIVEPDTYEVVAIIDSSGGRTYAGGGGRPERCSRDITLSSDDRGYILRSVQMRNDVDVGSVTVGWDVPASVNLRRFPDSVVERVPILEPCRYIVVDNTIAIVDPSDQRVVVLIED